MKNTVGALHRVLYLSLMKKHPVQTILTIAGEVEALINVLCWSDPQDTLLYQISKVKPDETNSTYNVTFCSANRDSG
jgi:hypothetical protein